MGDAHPLRHVWSKAPLPEPPRYVGDDPYRVYRLFHPMSASQRRMVHARRAAVVAELRALDEEAVDLIRRRQEVVEEAQAIHETLWPRLRYPNPRRPPRPDRPPLPPVAPGAAVLVGRSLRRTCLALLRHHGQLTLWELQAALHLNGCVIGGRFPTKGLADAMRFEVEHGRAMRVARATYAATDRDGRAETDPLLALDPESWYPAWVDRLAALGISGV